MFNLPLTTYLPAGSLFLSLKLVCHVTLPHLFEERLLESNSLRVHDDGVISGYILSPCNNHEWHDNNNYCIFMLIHK